jgi:hypothetical protein
MKSLSRDERPRYDTGQLIRCPGCGGGMRDSAPDTCSRCRSANRHTETMTRRQEQYDLRLRALRDTIAFAKEPMPGWLLPPPPASYIAEREAELERLERYCGLRP